MSEPQSARDLGLCLCHGCGGTCDVSTGADRCPRCHAPLHSRKPNAIARTWALMLAALIFYIPANIIPIMRTEMLGDVSESTIMSGVISFWQHGSWDIALIIFIASIGVPAVKFASLTLLLVTVQMRSEWAQAQRTRLYRFVEFIGYWSMLDVVVVALVAALVKFQTLGEVGS